MTEISEKNTQTLDQELFPMSFKTKAKFTLTFTFLVIFALGLLGFVMLRLSIAQAMGETEFPIDIFSIALLVFGSITLTYLYYKRYAKRELNLTNEGCSLMVGNRTYEYSWKEFSLVALSIAPSSTGIKGFVIRLYESDLEGEYIELPLYRFPKQVDIFELRAKIDTIVRPRDKRITI